MRAHLEESPASAIDELAPHGLWPLITAVALAAFVVAAVGLEMLAATAADTPEPGWAYSVVPLAWSPPRRVAWWLGVAAAAAGHRVLVNRWYGRRRCWLGPLLCALPFCVFAGGVAGHAQWAAWG